LEIEGCKSTRVHLKSALGLSCESGPPQDHLIERADPIVTVCFHSDTNYSITPPDKRKSHFPFDDSGGFDRVRLEIREDVNYPQGDAAVFGFGDVFWRKMDIQQTLPETE